MQTARVVRGEVLALKEREFVLAARSIGAPPYRMILRHILPNTLSPITVAAALGIDKALLMGLSALAHNVTPISAHLAMAEATLESVMERLAAYLAQVPAADRGSSSAALAALAHQPEDHARKAAILRLLIDAPPLVHETATGTDQAQK